mmetsp:Transcript_13140/g.52438  ORF Transcript_13140/g.52438 Transcript_13140/m.52438 type:complete len:208 (-) Transcript_13140:453-1076(-)
MSGATCSSIIRKGERVSKWIGWGLFSSLVMASARIPMAECAGGMLLWPPGCSTTTSTVRLPFSATPTSAVMASTARPGMPPFKMAMPSSRRKLSFFPFGSISEMTRDSSVAPSRPPISSSWPNPMKSVFWGSNPSFMSHSTASSIPSTPCLSSIAPRPHTWVSSMTPAKGSTSHLSSVDSGTGTTSVWDVSMKGWSLSVPKWGPFHT